MTKAISSQIIPLYWAHIPPSVAAIAAQVMETGQIASGPQVGIFENLLRTYLGNPWVTCTGDISASLTLTLMHAGVRPGDEVLMSPLVCLSTSCPVRNLFAKVSWCDVDPLTGNIDPGDIQKRITSRTKAIVVYHWAGNPADIEAIHNVARTHDLVVIEDAGEALGAEFHGRKIGATKSDYAVFSFYPNRHLSTLDGGAIACAREDDFEKLQWLKRYGIHQPTFRTADGEINPASDIPTAGWNSYMSNVAAAIGAAQFEGLPSRIARYQENGLFYDEKLREIPDVTVINCLPDSRSAYWVYTFLAEKRDHLLNNLRRMGVHASKVHLRNDHYTCFGNVDEQLPGVDYFSSRCLCIPCGWWVSEEDRKLIVEAIREESR